MLKKLQAREWYVLDCDAVKHVTDDAGKSGEFERLLNETFNSKGFENGNYISGSSSATSIFSEPFLRRADLREAFR